MLCIICHDIIKTGEGKVFTCGHVFHGKCAENWFKASTRTAKTCPSCRAQLDPSQCTTLYIASETATPQQRYQTRDARLQLENRRLRDEIEELAAVKLRLELDKEVMKVQLEQAERRIEVQRVASVVLAGESTSQEHELYDSLLPHEASQLLVSYHKEIEKLQKKFNDLQRQLLEKAADNEYLEHQVERLQSDIAFLENIEGGRTRISTRAPSNYTESPLNVSDSVTFVGSIPPPGSSTPSEARRTTVTTASTAAETANLLLAAHNRRVNTGMQTSRIGGATGTPTAARSVRVTSALTRNGAAAGATAAARGNGAAISVARSASAAGTTSTTTRSRALLGTAAAARGTTAATRSGAITARSVATSTRTSVSTDSSGVTRDSFRGTRRSLAVAAPPAKLARQL